MDLLALENQIAPIIRQLIESPAVQEDIELAEKAITSYLIQIIAEEANKSIFSKIINYIKDVYKMLNLQLFNDTTNDIATAAETAAEASLVASANAALSTVSTTIASTNANPLTELIMQADNIIATLEAEESGNSKSEWVKTIRDPFEVAVIKALVVGATAGSAIAIAALVAKLKK